MAGAKAIWQSSDRFAELRNKRRITGPLHGLSIHCFVPLGLSRPGDFLTFRINKLSLKSYGFGIANRESVAAEKGRRQVMVKRLATVDPFTGRRIAVTNNWNREDKSAWQLGDEVTVVQGGKQQDGCRALTVILVTVQGDRFEHRISVESEMQPPWYPCCKLPSRGVVDLVGGAGVPRNNDNNNNNSSSGTAE